MRQTGTEAGRQVLPGGAAGELPGAAPRLPPRWIASLFLLALLPALWTAHAPAFRGPFYLDSIRHLESRTNLHMVELSWHSLGDAIRLDYGLQIYRPLSQLTFALNHWGFGAAPGSFRAVNVVIHCLATAAFLLLSVAVLRSPRVAERHPEMARDATLAAVLGAALWSLHPIQTNVVAYVVQRMASLSGLFLFLGLGCYLTARREGLRLSWLAAALLCFFLSLASKESAIVALPLAIAGEVFLLHPPRSRRARTARNLAGALAGAGLLAALAWQGPGYWRELNELSASRPFTPWERLLTEARLQADYLLVLLVPDPRLLTLDAEVAVSRSLFRPPATALLFASVLGAAVLAACSRKRYPLLGFAISWFLLAQLMEATVIPLELYFEHRMYVPAAMLFLGLGALSVTALRRRRIRGALVCGLALFLGAEAWATHERSALWARPIAFHLDAAAKAPGKPRPHTNLGYAFRQAGYLDEARSEFLRALELGGDQAENLVNLAAVSYQKGDLDAAREHLQKGIAADPERAWTWQADWAQLELEAGNLPEAFRHAGTALRQNPRDARSLFLLGEILLAKGDPKQARQVLEVGLRYDPSRAAALHLLGRILLDDGEPEGAVRVLERALRLAPDFPAYLEDLTRARAALGTSAR